MTFYMIPFYLITTEYSRAQISSNNDVNITNQLTRLQDKKENILSSFSRRNESPDDFPRKKDRFLRIPIKREQVYKLQEREAEPLVLRSQSSMVAYTIVRITSLLSSLLT